MGLLDSLLDSYTGGGLLGAPSSWQYPTSAPDASEEKKKQDAAFLAGINQDPNVGGFNPGQPSGTFPASAPALAGTNGGIFGGSTPFGLGGINLPPQSQGAPASGAFPAVPFMPPQAPQAPPAPPPQQASPIAPQEAPPLNAMNIGGYKMPQIGNAADYTPTASIPANAQPTQGQLPQAPQGPATPPAFLQPPSQGGFGGAFRGMAANAQAGPLGMIMGALGGAAGMGRGNPQDIAQQNLRAQYDAVRQTLMANGDDPQKAASKAMIAVMNPEAAKTILPELFTNRQQFKTIKDGFGGEKPAFVSEIDQTINNKPIDQYLKDGGGSGDFQGVTDKITSMRTQGATREQLLQQIPTGYRDDVQSLISGKAVPANMGRSEMRGKLITLAKTVDPAFDETLIPTRVAMRKDFAGEGKNGQSIGSFNTAQHHIDKLSDDLETVAKFQGNYPTINAIRGGLANGTNSNPELRDALQSLNTDMAAVSHEVGNAYNAGHLSDHDMATWNALTNSNLPPDQLRRGIADFVDLLNGKRDSLNNMYRQQFGEDAPSIEKEKNAAVTAKVHQRSPQYGGAASSGLPSGWSVKAH